MCLSISVRPSHADLPNVSTPLLPERGLDQVYFSDDNHVLGTREHPSDNIPNISHQLVNQVGGTQSVTAEGIHDRLSETVREREQGTHALSAETPSFHPNQARSTSHRKAHRKTNRRKCSNDDSPPLMSPDYDDSSDEEKFFFNLPASMETQSDDSDSVVPVSQSKALWEDSSSCII